MMGSSPAVNLVCWGSVSPILLNLTIPKGRYADLGLQDGSKVFNTELVQALELGNMIDVAETVAISATQRKESRGAHTRTDYPTRNDAELLKHSVVRFSPSGPTLDYKPVTLTRWEPEDRKY